MVTVLLFSSDLLPFLFAASSSLAGPYTTLIHTLTAGSTLSHQTGTYIFIFFVDFPCWVSLLFGVHAQVLLFFHFKQMDGEKRNFGSPGSFKVVY